MTKYLLDIFIIAHSLDDIISWNKNNMVKNCSNRIIIFLLNIENEHKETEYDILTNFDIEITSNFEDINRWIEKSQNNLLFLDCNILICDNWLCKIQDIFNEDFSVGTISPIIANELEFNCENSNDLNDIQKIAIQCSMNLKPKTNELNKKCLFINRKFLNIGIDFDWKLIYEMDLFIDKLASNITQFGLRNIICDFFVVFDMKYELKKKVLFNNNYLKTIYDNINLHLLVENNKLNVMYQLHSDFKKDSLNNIGGTQLHVKDLVSKLRNRYNLFVVAKDKSNINLTIYIEEKEISFKFNIDEDSESEQLYSQRYREIYVTIIKSFIINIIHVQHCLGMTRELFYIGKEMGIPIITTIHDYYFLCPCLLMLDTENHLCIGNEDSDKCGKCLEERLNISNGYSYLKFWRRESLKVLELCDIIIVPSNSAKYNITNYFAGLKNKIEIIEHGIDTKKTNTKITNIVKKNFSIAFVGSLGPEKGSKYAYELIRNGSRDISWFICGIAQDYLLLNLEQKNLTSLGSYDREYLPTILKDNAVDLVCILSICPETYSYTLSEVIASGVPVIVMDTGALGERVRHLKCGWIVPQECNYREILKTIDEIRRDTKGYNKVLTHINNMKIRNVNNMALDYQKVYDQFFKTEKKYQYYDSNMLYLAYQSANCNEVYSKYCSDVGLVLEVERLRNELRRVKNSGAYILGVRIITKIKIPFKNTIKKIIYKNRSI